MDPEKGRSSPSPPFLFFQECPDPIEDPPGRLGFIHQRQFLDVPLAVQNLDDVGVALETGSLFSEVMSTIRSMSSRHLGSAVFEQVFRFHGEADENAPPLSVRSPG